MLTSILQPSHLILILVVALLVLGPKRLPDAGRALGQGLREFKASIGGHENDENPRANVRRLVRRVLASGPLSLLGAVLVAACGTAATGRVIAPRSARMARWLAFAHMQRPLDPVASDGGGRIVAAADGRLSLLGPTARRHRSRA
jgi:sec-independent protein translocase protein TatA